LVRAALDTLGYDWDRGRLDTAPHPFSTGTQFDARVTTRFKADDPLDAVRVDHPRVRPRDLYPGPALGALRHAAGRLAGPLGPRVTVPPLGEPRRPVPAVLGLFADTVDDYLGVDAAPGEFYEAANTVHPDNLIRVEADELTYHMHIVLRFRR